jgi:hypothetical protein
VNQTIDVIVTEFFDERLVGAGSTRRGRLRFLEKSLRDYLEAEGERILVSADLVLLTSERQFDPHGAFCRTMHADDLVFALPGFLERCVPADVTDFRVQLATIEALVAWLIRKRQIDPYMSECILLDVGAGLRRGRAELRSRCAAPASPGSPELR